VHREELPKGGMGLSDKDRAASKERDAARANDRTIGSAAFRAKKSRTLNPVGYLKGVLSKSQIGPRGSAFPLKGAMDEASRVEPLELKN